MYGNDTVETYRAAYGNPEQYRQAATAGDSVAQYRFGAYYSVQGPDRDLQKAEYWLKLAAQQGLIQAEYGLGILYWWGSAPNYRFSESATWLRIAANKGHADAQYGLGCLYKNGWGVPQGEAEAERWWTLAAAQGHGPSRTLLSKKAGKSGGCMVALSILLALLLSAAASHFR